MIGHLAQYSFETGPENFRAFLLRCIDGKGFEMRSIFGRLFVLLTFCGGVAGYVGAQGEQRLFKSGSGVMDRMRQALDEDTPAARAAIRDGIEQRIKRLQEDKTNYSANLKKQLEVCREGVLTRESYIEKEKDFLVHYKNNLDKTRGTMTPEEMAAAEVVIKNKETNIQSHTGPLPAMREACEGAYKDGTANAAKNIANLEARIEAAKEELKKVGENPPVVEPGEIK